MKNLKKSKIILFAGCFILLLTATGIWAYFNQQDFRDNEFTTAAPGISVIEVFDPSDDWVPGEKKVKKPRFENTGTMDMLLRFKVEEQVHNGNEWVNPETIKNGNTPMYTIKWNSASGTEPASGEFEDGKDGYYYYKKIIPAGGETPDIMEYVQMGDWLTNQYQGYKIDITITGEMIQTDPEDAVKEMWKKSWEKDPENEGLIKWSDASKTP